MGVAAEAFETAFCIAVDSTGINGTVVAELVELSGGDVAGLVDGPANEETAETRA